MNDHTHNKELLMLSALGELEEHDALRLEEHLQACAECRAELRELKQVPGLARGARFEVTEAMLDEARRALHAELRSMPVREPLGRRLRGFFEQLFAMPVYKAAFGGVAMTVIGVMIGYALFSPSPTREQAAALVDTSAVPYEARQSAGEPFVMKAETRTENIRIIHADEGDGQVEFIFDAITPVRVSGHTGDKNVQRMLARALVNEENPGVRLRAMSVIADQTDEAASGIDEEVRSALVTALNTDDNPAVRRQAVNALQKFSADLRVQRALCNALLRDKNAGVRVAAVNTLAAASVAGRAIDASVLASLKQKGQYDKNIFIRNQSRNVLEEASQL